MSLQVRRTNKILPDLHNIEKGYFAKQAINEAVLSAHLAQTGRCDPHGHGLAQKLDHHHDPTLVIGHLVDGFDTGKRPLLQGRKSPTPPSFLAQSRAVTG